MENQETVITNLKNRGLDFSNISKMNIIIIANKMDMTYDYCIKHNMEAIEGKLNKLINNDKKLINKLPQNWIHPLNRKFGNYCT